LWYALFAPDESWQRVAEAETQVKSALKRQPAKDSSHEYLRRTRFLGAYRQFLQKTLPSEADVNGWEHPSDTAPHWLRATTLKYRGAIRAARSESDGAIEDFASAYELLRLDKALTVQVIAWSIAAQAVLSLPAGKSSGYEQHLRENVQCVVDYLSGFEPSRDLARTLKNGNLGSEALASFQRGFAY
jgi:hypothetical protein